MQTQTFGNYLEAPEPGADLFASSGKQAKLVLGLTPAALSDCQSWRSNGLSAEFLADYVSLCFPSEPSGQRAVAPDERASMARRQVHDAVHYIVNELLENAIKYSYLPAHCPVEVLLSIEQAELRLYLTNCIERSAAEHFRNYIQRLLAADPATLYLQQMEENAQAPDRHVSQLGYLSILTHYPTQLAWKFSTNLDAPSVITVTTLVRLKV